MHHSGDIEALIREEKRLSALESHAETWAEGLAAGIEAEILAEAALTTALGELVRGAGESSAAALLERMRERIGAGDFNPSDTRH